MLAGIPYGMIADPLNFWLAKSGVERSTIGLLSLVFTLYSFKALWAPFVDRFELPLLNKLGQRKSWLLFSHFFISIFLLLIGGSDPSQNLDNLVYFVIALAFFSATQDICVDALRIEMVESQELGQSAAVYQTGWRIGGVIITQVIGMIIGGLVGYSLAYLSIAIIFIILSLLVLLYVEEPQREIRTYISPYTEPTKWLFDSFVNPVIDLYERYKTNLMLILATIFVYRLSDMYLGPMAMPFYQSIGFTEVEIALVTNAFGAFITILGALIGGVLVHKWGINKALVYGAVLTVLTNLPFLYLNYLGNEIWFLWVTIGMDNLTQGFVGVATIAFVSNIVSKSYTATQFALLVLFATLPSRIIGSSSGFVVDSFGFHYFFILAAILGIPAIILTYIIYKKEIFKY
tara:strand:- start:36 stop:1244 length:1209 start_codon:yes stop_codon:yes gene_type:complete